MIYCDNELNEGLVRRRIAKAALVVCSVVWSAASLAVIVAWMAPVN